VPHLRDSLIVAKVGIRATPEPHLQKTHCGSHPHHYNQNMFKGVTKTESSTLLSKDDRAFLTSFRKSSKRHVNKVTQTRAKAMQELIDAGIYETNGKLSKKYR
jgi:hypothetical protein